MLQSFRSARLADLLMPNATSRWMAVNLKREKVVFIHENCLNPPFSSVYNTHNGSIYSVLLRQNFFLSNTMRKVCTF